MAGFIYYTNTVDSTSTTWYSNSSTNATPANTLGDWQIVSCPTRYRPLPISQPTAQERQRRAEVERRCQQERRERELANHQAEALLKHILGDEEYTDYKKVGYIEVDSHRHPGAHYRISSNGGVVTINKDGKQVDYLCIHTKMGVPAPDQIIAKVLTAHFDEERFLKTANRSRV